MHPKIAIIEAPSNLGLRPPAEGCVPGCYKAPWALRNAGLARHLDAIEIGCVIPPRYDPHWEPGATTRNSKAIAEYSRSVASAVEQALNENLFPLLIGGDCSILIGAGLALKRRGTYGLLFLDGHTDFRHLGNTGKIDAAAGEDLAISVGLGDQNLINLSGIGPNFDKLHVAVVGVRPSDEHLKELAERSIFYKTSSDVIASLSESLDPCLSLVSDQTKGFWLHVDLDVVDCGEMFAADCPEPEGISFRQLSDIIRLARATKKCVGMDVTIYDPDLDPDAYCAQKIVSCLKDSLGS